MEEKKIYKYKRVMVIDDSEIDRYIAKQIIRFSSFAEEVILEYSATDALETLSAIQAVSEVPAVIFLDISMPELDAFGFMERYNGLADIIKDNCAIAVISSSADPSDHKRLTANRYVKHFIGKPLDEEKLERHFGNQ